MSNFSLWLVLAGILLIAEITTGTFYLLMVSLGAAVGALMAYLGYGLEIQIAAAAVLAVAGSLLLRNRSINRSKTDKQHDVLDIGNKLQVTNWDANGRASVQYRGATWAAESIDSTPVTGLHQIVDVQGNILKVKSVSTHV